MADKTQAEIDAEKKTKDSEAQAPKSVVFDDLDPKRKYIARYPEKRVTVALKPKLTAAQVIRNKRFVVIDGRELQEADLPAGTVFIDDGPVKGK